MARGPGKLRGTTKSNDDHIWDGFGIIKGLVVYLEIQIGDWLTQFDPKNIQK